MLAYYEKAIEGIVAAEKESWKRDHESAVGCLEFEQIVREANRLYRDMGETFDRVYDQALELPEGEAKARIDRWLSMFQRVERSFSGLISRLPAYEANGYQVSGAEELRRNRNELARNLLSHEEFFSGEGFRRFTQEAVESHARGETEPMIEFGS